ncbi:MAG: YbhB/YbcL family Raf kinase inhibitor-like protein [Pseudomonadota bacterium]|jgi:Raf kinase inhibitor-like YbhB/YbcL family protein
MPHHNPHSSHHHHDPAHHPEHSGKAIAILRVKPYEATSIPVFSPAVLADGKLDAQYAADHDNVSPPLTWTNVLEAETYCLIVEDPDAPMDKPFVHWLVWNIPGTADSLPRHLPVGNHPPELNGAIQGRNSLGGHGWYGMKPPAGHGVHHYHFQLFALNRALPFDAGASVDELVQAMKGCTIASGELVGTYEIKEGR